jgi:ribonuclease H-related protein
MSKYYAVKKGNETGIFRTWDECQKQVKGFSGAQFKSFVLKKDAEDYLKGTEKKQETLKEEGDFAYTDGSFKKEEKVMVVV